MTLETTSDFTAGQHDELFAGYRFRSGETLPDLRLHYATAGTPVRDASGAIVNAVLMLHWTSASGAALRTPEFVESLYAAGKPLDAGRFFLIFPDNVGHGRSSKPSDGLRCRFPKYGYRDMIDLQHRLVGRLGIRKLRAVVGLSMGGMHAWLWAEEFPDQVEAIMPIVSLPARIRGRNLLWRRIIERQILTDPDYKGGDYSAAPRGWTEAFPLFRMMLDGVPHLQEIITGKAAADDFIQAAADQSGFADANDVLYSLESSGDYDPEPKLPAIRARVFALNFTDDEFNPVSLGILEKLVSLVPGARYELQQGTAASFGHLTLSRPSLWGHHVLQLGL